MGRFSLHIEPDTYTSGGANGRFKVVAVDSDGTSYDVGEVPLEGGKAILTFSSKRRALAALPELEPLVNKAPLDTRALIEIAYVFVLRDPKNSVYEDAVLGAAARYDLLNSPQGRCGIHSPYTSCLLCRS